MNFTTLARGTAPRLPATHAVLHSAAEVRQALGYLPAGAEWVSPQRPAILVSLGPHQLSRVQIRSIAHRRGGSTLEYVVRRDHEFPVCFQTPRSPIHLVQLDRPVERLRFVRYREGVVYGQLIEGEDGQIRLLELPELGLLEDECYLIHRSGWTRRGSFRATVADAWTHEGNHLVPLTFNPNQPLESILRLIGRDVQDALREHAGVAVAVRGLVQNATRRILPWRIGPAFMDDAPLLFDSTQELVVAA